MIDRGKYIERYRKLHRQDWEEDLSDAEALAQLESLIALVKAVYQPIPTRENYENTKRL